MPMKPIDTIPIRTMTVFPRPLSPATLNHEPTCAREAPERVNFVRRRNPRQG